MDTTSENRYLRSYGRLAQLALYAVLGGGCAAGDVPVVPSPPSIAGTYDATMFHGRSIPYSADGIEFTSQRLTFAEGGSWTGMRVTTYPTRVDTMFWTGAYTPNGVDLVYSTLTVQSGGALGAVVTATSNSASARVSLAGMVFGFAYGPL